MTSHKPKEKHAFDRVSAYISESPRAVCPSPTYLPQRGNDAWIIASLQTNDPSCAALHLAFCILRSCGMDEKLADHMYVTDCA